MRHPVALAALLMLSSGFAGLGYQIIWTQQASLWLGHESAAVLAVVSAFFGGLALGAALLGPRIDRSGNPARWYAACEAVIAIWALVLVGLFPAFTQAMLALTGEQPSSVWQWFVAFSGCGVLLLPATAAMGATLPASARWLGQMVATEPEEVLSAARRATRSDLSIPWLYAMNTGGAVTGVLTIAFWGLPELGLQRCTLLCAALNAACAAASWSMAPRPAATRESNAIGGEGVSSLRADPSANDPHMVTQRRRIACWLAITGLLGIGYEITVVRVISQVAEDTVYTFALLLAVYLAGTSLGAGALARWQGDQQRNAAGRSTVAAWLLALLALACAAGGASLWWAEAVRDGVALALAGHSEGLLPSLGGEAAMAVAAFVLPTLAMGALFSHLATQAGACGLGLGRALAINTMGAAMAPLLVGVALLPIVGVGHTLLLLVLGYAALAAIAIPGGAGLRAGSVRMGGALLGLSFFALLAWQLPPLTFVSLPPAGRLLSYTEGALASVSVTEDAEGTRRLHINNRQQEGSSSSLIADGRQALLPLLLHPAPSRVMFLGLGTGLTASAALQDPRLEVHAVELLPEVIEAKSLFQGDWADPDSAGRLRVIAGDARRQIRVSEGLFDVIVADNVHPARSGTGSLYTVEHFRAVHARLAQGGLFCQWLPLHQMDRATLSSIVAAFRAVWPNGRALLATHSLDTPTLGLLGHASDAEALSVRAVRRRLTDSARLPLPPKAFGLHDEWAVLGSLIAGPSALAALSQGAVANTDDRPVVAYRAPRATYSPTQAPRDRLLGLLPELSVVPGELLRPDEAAAEPRLAAYRQARDAFLVAGRHVRPTADPKQMLDQVGEPLLAVLQRSPDFRPAFDPLMALAVALAAQDEASSKALLARLHALRPSAFPRQDLSDQSARASDRPTITR